MISGLAPASFPLHPIDLEIAVDMALRVNYPEIQEKKG